MSSRERWIVYPILFMTLGIALRDKIVPPSRFQAGEITAQQVKCNLLESGQSDCRALLVKGKNGKPVVVAGTEPQNHAGMVETFDANGIPQVRLLSSDTGGAVSTFGHAGKVAVFMGHIGPNFGVFAQLPDLGPPIPLTMPWKFEKKPTPPGASKSPAPPKTQGP